MGRRERTGAVNETRDCAVSAGWPGALKPALLRVANIQKRCRLLIAPFRKEKLCARARFKSAKRSNTSHRCAIIHTW